YKPVAQKKMNLELKKPCHQLTKVKPAGSRQSKQRVSAPSGQRGTSSHGITRGKSPGLQRYVKKTHFCDANQELFYIWK
ncbi:hypothetical protein BX616_008786, partial [Lobosporangium transversale]